MGGPAYPGFYNCDVNFLARGYNQQWGINARVEYELGNLRLVSISSYRKLDAEVDFDTNGTPAVRQQATIQQKSRTASEERQLQSNAGPVPWVLRGYYWYDRSGALPLNLYINGAAFDRYAKQITNPYAAFGQATGSIFTNTNVTASDLLP